jgi:PadR family transcriptional regulator, regulatory protein AphA
MAADLTPFSYAILCLVGRNGAGPHDLARMMREGQAIWSSARSQYYAEPKRLERLGLLASSKEPGRTRDRTVYRLTPAGVEALREWMEQPTPPPTVGGEAPVRMVAGDLVDEGAVRASLLAMRDGIDALRAQLTEAEARAATIAHRTKYLLLSHRLARHVLDAYDVWLDEVERELEP